jgi:hypothetical protein
MPAGYMPSFLELIFWLPNETNIQIGTADSVGFMFVDTVDVERYTFSGLDADMYCCNWYVFHIDTGDM